MPIEQEDFPPTPEYSRMRGGSEDLRQGQDMAESSKSLALNKQRGTCQSPGPLEASVESLEAQLLQRQPVPGIIKRLKMTNIMSHINESFENLDQKPIILITGEKGAGKSAIVAAIVAGLGGSAFETGRGNSIKELISHGMTQGRIEIVLHNPDLLEYPKEITIITTLTRKGGSRHQIKDDNGVLKDLNRSELNLISTKLNIQVDNPLAILSQDAAQQLLNTSDAEELYKFVYKALLLDACESILNNANNDVCLTKDKLEEKKQLLKKSRKKKLELKTKKDTVERLESKSREKLDTNHKLLEDKENILKKYKEAKEYTKKLKKEIKSMDDLTTLMQSVLKEQKCVFKTSKSKYGMRLEIIFKHLIESRHYKGDLIINHDKKQLHCYVCSEATTKETAATSLTGPRSALANRLKDFASRMSVSERSFSTICLLVSCWALMDMPFVILDEFDVFMDPLNRQEFQRMLMQAANEKITSQLIFLTPLVIDTLDPQHKSIIRGINIKKNGRAEEQQ